MQKWGSHLDGGCGRRTTHTSARSQETGTRLCPQRKLPSFKGCDSKDGVVLIFLLPIFTLTNERGGKVAGMNFPVFSKQGKGHFAFFFFFLSRIFLKILFLCYFKGFCGGGGKWSFITSPCSNISSLNIKENLSLKTVKLFCSSKLPSILLWPLNEPSRPSPRVSVKHTVAYS